MVLHPPPHLLLLLHVLLPLPLRSLTHSRSLPLAVLFWGGSQSIAFEAVGLLRTLLHILHLLQSDRVKKTRVMQDPDCSQGRAPARLPDGVQTQRESSTPFVSHITQRDEQGHCQVISGNIDGHILRVALAGKPSHHVPSGGAVRLLQLRWAKF